MMSDACSNFQVLWHPSNLSMAIVVSLLCVQCVAHCKDACKLHGITSQHETSCSIAAGFGAQDIGLQSNFRGPSGQQGPYGSSGKPRTYYALLVCFAACIGSPLRGDRCGSVALPRSHSTGHKGCVQRSEVFLFGTVQCLPFVDMIMEASVAHMQTLHSNYTRWMLLIMFAGPRGSTTMHDSNFVGGGGHNAY